ncbi:Smr/MutS family protein, partial [Bdellovibrionota bacterium FG-2]
RQEDTAPPPPPAPGAKPLKAAEKKRFNAAQPAVPASQIDLRGERFDEAMSKLENYLDQAFRSSALKEVIIIHGLGSGSLREGARKLLAELPYIKIFRDAGAGQGGSGATLVEFDLD